ncbi:MAG: 4Fe-4S dicluster domain-containing protein [Thermodesulfobacteriota bacterium]
MKPKILKKRDSARFLDKLLREYEVFAPVKREDLVVFGRIHSGKEAFLDYMNSKMPPKEMLFPQLEILFTYTSIDDPSKIETPPSAGKPRLLFGTRPCDARNSLLLDKVFDGEQYKDTYYRDRRAPLVVVGIGCIQPCPTCFCTSVGGGPFSREGLDILLIDIGDDYVAQVVSDRGKKLLERRGLEDAGADKLSLVKKVIRDAEASMTSEVKIDGLAEKLAEIYDDPIWGLLTEKCLNCGVCTYLCPTCHCFDIVDEARDSGGKRIRIWDTCQFPLFTLQASGANPRPTNKERLRQRFMHKFKYFLDNYGQIGCVGCGRCVRECPVNVDIRQVLTVLSNRLEVAP